MSPTITTTRKNNKDSSVQVLFSGLFRSDISASLRRSSCHHQEMKQHARPQNSVGSELVQAALLKKCQRFTLAQYIELSEFRELFLFARPEILGLLPFSQQLTLQSQICIGKSVIVPFEWFNGLFLS